MSSLKIILIVICTYTSIIFSSQTALSQVNLDSLWGVWNDPVQPDTIRLKAIHKFAEDGYIHSQPDSAFYFAQLEYDFAKNRGLKKQMANALRLQGSSFYFQSSYIIAMDYYIRSIAIREEIGDKRGIASSLSNIGSIYISQGNYATSIDYYTRSIAIREEIGDKRGIATSLGNIGSIYISQGNYATAIDYYTRSLVIREEIGDKRGIASSLGTIGSIYMEQGDSTYNAGNIVLSADKYATALDYYTHSLAIQEDIEDKRGIASSLSNIGSIYMKQGDSAYNAGNIVLSADKYATALDYHARSLAIQEDIEDKKGIASSLSNIGSIYKEQGDFVKSIRYYTQALTITQEADIAVETMGTANSLYEIYKASNKNKQALEMYELYIATRDSINSEKNQREVISQKYRFEYEKQMLAHDIAHDEEQRVQEAKLINYIVQLYYLTGGLILLIGLLGFLYNRFRVIRKQKFIIEHQRNKIKSTLKKEKDLGELKSKFVSMTSHEFRTPLAAIAFASGSVKKYWERLDVDSRNEKLDKIETQVNHMTLLLDDILVIGKTESGKITSNFKLFNFNEFIKPIIDEVCILSKNSHQIKLINKNLDITILIDERLGRNIFINLLNNAIKFSSGKKEVILEVINFDDKMIQIKIIDFGVGIKNENIENIFTPFYREENAESIQGTGLGLSIVKDAVRLSKGTINVESTIDKGTTFIINLLKK